MSGTIQRRWSLTMGATDWQGREGPVRMHGDAWGRSATAGQPTTPSAAKRSSVPAVDTPIS